MRVSSCISPARQAAVLGPLDSFLYVSRASPQHDTFSQMITRPLRFAMLLLLLLLLPLLVLLLVLLCVNCPLREDFAGWSDRLNGDNVECYCFQLPGSGCRRQASSTSYYPFFQ